MIEPGDISMDQWKPDSTQHGFNPEPGSKGFMGAPIFLGKGNELIQKTVGDVYSFVLRIRGERPMDVSLYQRSTTNSSFVYRGNTTLGHGILGCIVKFPIHGRYAGRLKLRYIAENSAGKLPLDQDLHVTARQVGG